MLEDRERVILETLKKIPKKDVVLIGGYAVNAYVPPRFSIDCDLVVLDNLKKIKNILIKNGFEETIASDAPYKKFYRFERKDIKSAFDLLIDFVTDRSTGIRIPAKMIKKYSKTRTTVGRANPIRIRLRLANPEMLFIMKFLSCRKQDIRDIFMLSNLKLDVDFITKNLTRMTPEKIIKTRIQKVEDMITKKTFRDSLQGPYGYLPDKIFDNCKDSLLKILERFTGEIS